MNQIKPSEKLILIFTTEADMPRACKLADTILKKKLVACVSFKEIKSQFWWEGNITQSEE